MLRRTCRGTTCVARPTEPRRYPPPLSCCIMPAVQLTRRRSPSWRRSTSAARRRGGRRRWTGCRAWCRAGSCGPCRRACTCKKRQGNMTNRVRVCFLISIGSPQLRPMGVHRTCGEPNESGLTAINPLLNGTFRVTILVLEDAGLVPQPARAQRVVLAQHEDRLHVVPAPLAHPAVAHLTRQHSTLQRCRSAL